MYENRSCDFGIINLKVTTRLGIPTYQKYNW